MFSIYILTHNEELEIAACIESALLSDDVIVVDSAAAIAPLRSPVATQFALSNMLLKATANKGLGC